MMKKILIGISLLLLINNISFSDTDCYINFIINIDNVAPQYLNFSSNTTEINNNEIIEFSAYWEDNYIGLKDYYFEWNISNNFENSTSKNFIDGWSNITKQVTNPDYEGKQVAYSYYAYDNFNNLNHSEYGYFNVTNLAPEYYLVEQSNINVTAGEIVNLSSYWTDNFNVYEAVLETNKSSVWSTEELITIDSKSEYSNFTFNTSGYDGLSISWRIKASDNVGNINTTNELIFNVI